MQTRLISLIEAMLNTASGFIISWIMTFTVIPLFGYNVTISEGFGITVIYTVVSLVRSYLWRRYFNGILTNMREIT